MGNKYKGSFQWREMPHVLYLGLRHGDEQWNLVPLDVNDEMLKISARLVEKNPDDNTVKRRIRKKQDD